MSIFSFQPDPASFFDQPSYCVYNLTPPGAGTYTILARHKYNGEWITEGASDAVYWPGTGWVVEDIILIDFGEPDP